MEDRSCDRRLLKLRLKIRSTSAEPQYSATHVVLVILFWRASTPRISLDRSTRPQDYLFSSKTEIQGTSPKYPQRLLHPNPQACSSTKIPQHSSAIQPTTSTSNPTKTPSPASTTPLRPSPKPATCNSANTKPRFNVYSAGIKR